MWRMVIVSLVALFGRLDGAHGQPVRGDGGAATKEEWVAFTTKVTKS